MATAQHEHRTRPTRPWIRAILAAVSLAVLLVTPVAAAAPQDTDLRRPQVTPRQGTTATTFTLRVEYRDGDGDRPDFVRVTIGSVTHDMARDRGRDYRRGVRFEWTGALPAGDHRVTFTTHSHDDEDASLDAGSVSVKAAAKPTPTTAPAPVAKPTPTTAPAPVAKPKPTPTAKPKPPAAKPKPTARATAKPKPKPPARSAAKPTTKPDSRLSKPPADEPEPTPRETASDAPESLTGPTPSPVTLAVVPFVVDPVDPPDASPPPAAAIVDPVDPTGPDDGAGSAPEAPVAPRAWGPLTGLAAILGLGLGDGLPVLPLMPTLVTTTGVAAASMALGLFGRRRREDDPDIPDALLAARAAEGVGVGGAAVGLAEHDPEEPRPPADDGYDVDAEAAMPRWRRPSLLQARKADPLRNANVAPRLSFDQGFSGALSGHERRLIRFTVVRLLDAPDELRGNEIGVLGDGDEVELIEKQGVYWLVGCPGGGRGWIHQMTLGATVGPALAAEVPSATLPSAPDTWTLGESDVDDDVLAAYIASRRLAG